MLRSFKKMLVLIPCMIFGLFLLTNSSVSAADAKLLDSTKIVVGEENKDNTYYFTNNRVWEFKAQYNAIKNWDTYVTYRVIKPDGSATAESDYINYVNAGGRFNIGDITALNYSETVDVSTRNSIAPAATYYVDIKYYGGYFFFEWDQEKDETIKIVLNDDETLARPSVNIAYDNASNKVTVNASVMKEDKGYGVITQIDYYFADENITNQVVDFRNHMEQKEHSGSIEVAPANNVSQEIPCIEGKSYKYIYVMVTTANGYSEITAYDFTFNNQEEGVGEKNPTNTNDQKDEDGLFDYGFGDFILLVLVVVLIVSCVLIITQKIVDYKKRLY